MANETTSSFVTSRETGGAVYRFCYVQFHLSRALAGWQTTFKTIAQHCELSLLQYEDMQSCELLYKRMSEIPGGWGSKKPEGAFESFLQQIACAPNTDAFWLGVFEVIKPNLARAYIQHLSRTNDIMDSQSCEVMKKNWEMQQAQMDRNQIATNLLQERAKDPVSVQKWCAHLQAHLDAAGGLLGLVEPVPYEGIEYPNFKVAKTFVVESRQKQNFTTDTEFEVKNVQICNYYLNTELAAVPRLGRCIYEINDMPWDFYFDTARHMWDEIRHFQMGRTRLIELGYDPHQFTIPVWIYEAMRKLTALEDYAQLVLVAEANSFDYKQVWKKKCLEFGDLKSSAQQDFDIIDEQRHVRYGKKWMPLLKDLFKDPRPIEQIGSESAQKADDYLKRMANGEEGSIYDGAAYWRKMSVAA